MYSDLREHPVSLGRVGSVSRDDSSKFVEGPSRKSMGHEAKKGFVIKMD